MPAFRLFARLYWKAFLSVLFLPILGNIFAGEFRDLAYTWFGWKEPAWYLWLTTAIAGLAFVGLALLTVIFGLKAFRPQNVALGPKTDPPPHPHIVLFLSNIRPDTNKFHDDCTPKWLSLTDNLPADLAALIAHKPALSWAWEMPLRGLYHHRAVLATVTLVCSKESLAQAHWFAGLVRERYAGAFPRLKPDRVRLLVSSGTGVALDACPTSPAGCVGDPEAMGWEFEDYEELYAGLSGMMDRFAAEGVREKDVILDVTGGQKPNSIVGAILTVNRRAKFQYVQTGDSHQVVAYDLVTEAGD